MQKMDESRLKIHTQMQPKPKYAKPHMNKRRPQWPKLKLPRVAGKILPFQPKAEKDTKATAPRPEAVHSAAKPSAARFRPKRRTASEKKRLSFGDRLLRNTAISCALLLGILTFQNINQPWSNLALDGIESALTMRIDLDESLGRLSFVRDLVPESALVFLNITAQPASAPVSGTLTHSYSENQPWVAYLCEPLASVCAIEDGIVSAVTQLTGGDWGILVDHGNGLESVYAYLGSSSVQVGDAVSAGAQLGAASSADGASIYFELRSNGKAVDPSERLGL